MAIYKNAPKFVDRDELKSLWRMLRRLQGDVLLRNDGLGWNWTPKETEALITVMDAVRDTYEMAREQLATSEDPPEIED